MPAADPDAKIPCSTPHDLERELKSLSSFLSLGEKEDTWEKMEKALIRFAGITRGGGYKHMALYVEGVGRKGCGLQIVACMMSDRGRLSGVATELLQTLAPRLGLHFAPLVTLFLDPLVTLLGRPNKVFLKRAEKCLATIITHCQLPTILPILRRGLNDEAGTCRRGCAVGWQRIINEWDRDVVGEKGVVVLEDALRKMATDKDAEVRKIGKGIWGRYTDIWPDRVEDFSAPLTPTIRRYLDIPANGAPPKPKARPPPVVPKVPPPQPNSLASSTKSTASPPRAPNPRVQALGGRPVRIPPHVPAPPPAPVPLPFELEKPVAGPSRRQGSPRRAMDALPRPPPPVHSETEPMRLAKSSSSANLRAEAALPFKIGQHGRSASHAILPSAPSSSSLSSLPETSNPLARPIRPMLPPSFSSLSLPPDPIEALTGPKRVPSARRLPIMSQSETAEEEEEPVFVTPGPLRAPVRVQNPMHQARKMMGQAQRVVQPTPSESHMLTATAPRTVSRSVRDRIQDLEKASTPTKVEPMDVPLPLSPVVTKASPRMLTITSPTMPKSVLPPVSPMMPVLTISKRQTQEREDEMSATDLLKVELGEGLVDRTVIQANTSTESEDAPIVIAQEEEKIAEDVVSAPELPGELPRENEHTEPTEPLPVETPAVISDTDVEMAPIAPLPPSEEPSIIPITTPAEADVVVPEEVPIPSTGPASTTSTKPTLASSVSSRSTAASSAKAVVKQTVRPDVKLPSVAPKPSGRRAVTAPERKPFKPTSQTAPTPKSSTLTAPTASTAARALNTKASTKPEDVIRPMVKRAEATKPAIPPLPAPVAKPPVARVVSGGSFAAPTKASASRTTAPAPATTSAPAPKVTQTAPKVMLPPVKKEKVRLKPALPKFVPTRGGVGARSASESSAKLAESTSSIATSAAGERKPGVIRAKVKPEMVALPSSPVETKNTTVEGISTSPTVYTFKEGVVARVKKVAPEAVPLPDSPVAPTQPLAEHVPLPASPLATTSALPLVPDEVASPISNPYNRLNAIGLPMPPTAQTPISKASTAATAPYYDDSSDESDDEAGVTFKSSAGRTLDRTILPRPPVRQEPEGDLMEFSAPSRPSKSSGSENEHEADMGREGGKKGSTTPNRSPNRQALRLRDANTPGRKEEVLA